MGTTDTPQTCDECGMDNFRVVNDSILKRQYAFVAKSTLKMCVKCGAKYVCCPKCGALMTRVHLSIDVEGVRDTCPKCGHKEALISQWIARGGGGMVEK
jgi:predicted RNA-binding Zn-ribbon protein involved in translation (DUF1610 family)